MYLGYVNDKECYKYLEAIYLIRVDYSMNSENRDWTAIGLGKWKSVHDSFILHAEVMIEQYKSTGTIPTQPFSALFRNLECHSHGEEKSIFQMLPKAIRESLIDDHCEMFMYRRLSFHEKHEWLHMVCFHIKEEEDLVWTQLGGF